ncbi:MAG: ATP-binding protein, partial [Euryarchaeota archaeon]|nr:ATP-binding protein [Euryarchaeota archaeon]
RGWERAVRALGERPGCRVFITGSSSKVLSTDIATSLRGRTISYDVLPFSFLEFLHAKGLTVDERTPYSTRRHAVAGRLDEFMEFGGYPEVVLAGDRDTKVRILREYFNTMMIRDLIERYHIRNTVLLKEMAIHLISNLSCQFSISGYQRSVRERHGISKKTVQNFLSHFEDVRLVFPVKLFSPSLRTQQANPVKVYCADVGLRTAIGFYTSEDRGRILENLVLLELEHRRFREPRMEVFYWKGGNRELDFVVKIGQDVRQLLQVGWSLDDAATRKRELEGLSRAMEAFGLREGFVITRDEEGRERLGGGRTATIVPFWKWAVSGPRAKDRASK